MSPITALNTILGPAGRGLLGYRLPCRRPAQYLLATPAIQFRSTIFRRCNASIAHATVQDQVVYDGNFGVSSGLTMPDTFHSGHTYPVPPEKRTSRQEPLGSKPAPEAPQNMRGNDSQVSLAAVTVPAYHRGSKFERNPYWQRIGRWKGVTETKFLSHQWNTTNDVQGRTKLYHFLNEVLPDFVPIPDHEGCTKSREEFVIDVMLGIDIAPMSIRLTPHILSSINWNDPYGDPLSRQFIPKKSNFQPDHPKLKLDSLHEAEDSPCEGLVHRYSDKCLFLASSHCPIYCRFCTRSYAVGGKTDTVTKASIKPGLTRWNKMLDYIAATPSIQDVVVSGGDSYTLSGSNLRMIGDRLLSIPHVRRFRVATRGLCVSPSRTLDPEDDWTDELIRLSKIGRERGVHVALHTHFNHPNEISWITREAAQRLHQEAVVVRNQSVLLKGVNDSAETMGNLIRELADNNIIPYYVYAGDMVKGVDCLRTPLQTILDLECELRGSIAGFMTPQFVVDLPGGGGKRLAASYKTYDRLTGVSTFVAPAVKGRDKKDKIYEYYDPLAAIAMAKEKAGKEQAEVTQTK